MKKTKIVPKSFEVHTSLNVLDNFFKFFLCEHVELLARLHRGELERKPEKGS